MPKYRVTPEEAGQKCIAFIQRKCSIPILVIHKLIRKGTIRINGKRCKPFTRLQEEDDIFLPVDLDLYSNKVIHNNQKTHSVMDTNPLESNKSGVAVHTNKKDILSVDQKKAQEFLHTYILYEDAHLLVLNKPSGIPVHNGTRHSESIATFLHVAYFKAPFSPTLVHRLDKETTGILLIAKSYSMLQELHTAWRDNCVEKYYLAWVQGIWETKNAQRIEHAIERTNRGVVALEGNDVAITVRCLQKARASSLLCIRLHNGKTHQIRAQLSQYGFPIIGDKKYSSNSKKLPLFLHATALCVNDSIHYVCLPNHWTSNFTIRVPMPQLAIEYHTFLHQR